MEVKIRSWLHKSVLLNESSSMTGFGIQFCTIHKFLAQVTHTFHYAKSYQLANEQKKTQKHGSIIYTGKTTGAKF